jgi:hypothetical protein
MHCSVAHALACLTLVQTVIYLHTEFHAPSSSGSLVITIKLTANCSFNVTTMLFYTKA